AITVALESVTVTLRPEPVYAPERTRPTEATVASVAHEPIRDRDWWRDGYRRMYGGSRHNAGRKPRFTGATRRDGTLVHTKDRLSELRGNTEAVRASI
ncbi:MAG: hypothetical protein Q8P82_00560, partial [bacterium]|nr:hypothetical protein [bacterium]